MQFWLVFHFHAIWSLSGSKCPQLSVTLLKILANLEGCCSLYDLDVFYDFLSNKSIFQILEDCY